MEVELVRAQVRVRERAEAVEHEVAEVEQPTPADDDVEAEGEHHEEHGVEGDPPPVPVGHADGQEREEHDEERQPCPPGDAPQALLERAERPAATRRDARRAARPTRRVRRRGSSVPRRSPPRARLRAGSGETRRRSGSLISHLPDVRPAEEPLRAHQHEHDQDREDDEVRPLGRDVGLRHRLDQPEQVPPSIAPGIEPMPPITAATNPASPTMKPICG